jgi:hypothetical protein
LFLPLFLLGSCTNQDFFFQSVPLPPGHDSYVKANAFLMMTEQQFGKRRQMKRSETVSSIHGTRDYSILETPSLPFVSGFCFFLDPASRCPEVQKSREKGRPGAYAILSVLL